MKKLDDIPKKAVFNAPEGYFDKLPGIVQARVSQAQPEQKGWAFGWRLAMPLAALVILGIIFWPSESGNDISPDQIVSSLNTDDILDYMQDENLNTDDLLEALDYSQMDESDVTLFGEEPISDAELEQMIDEL